MTAEKLPYTVLIKGRTYFSVRVNGKLTYAPLPPRGTPEFDRQYQKLKDDHVKSIKNREAKRSQTSNAIDGTFKALVVEYQKSSSYRDLARNTKVDADRYFGMFIEAWGDMFVAHLEPGDVDRCMDDMHDTPGKALNWIKWLKLLIDMGIRRGYRKDKYNPAQGVKRPRVGEHDPWPLDVLEHVMSEATPMLRLAIATGLYSGQRISDCVNFCYSNLKGDMLEWTQQKTGVEVFVPIHPDWVLELDRVKPSRVCDNIIYNRWDHPFTEDAMQLRIRTIMRQLLYVDDDKQALYTFHGLRKNSANHLAELGLSPHEIGAICGMDLKTVQHYTHRVNKRILAVNVSDRVMAADRRRVSSNLRLVG